ncbi:MAG TPA: hypothetical protein VKR53_04100 [Puia sp.]|nr:hypothetical protein [Puia sp.]
MTFYISPIIEGKLTRLKVEKIFESPSIERFEVTAKNKSLTLQTNRILFQNRGLKHRKGQWTIVAGNLNKSAALQRITDAIDKELQ